jgi:threonine/homoserine/homoserine lactone efflux protein
MANGGRLGLRKAFAGMLGACAGNLCLVALSAFGLGLVVSQNELLFNLIKWIGAAYLVFMGVQIIRAPLQQQDVQSASGATTMASVWRTSFFIALSNPKALIYFGALFPQFISYQQPLAVQFLLLTITFLITDLVWMFVYAIAGNKIMRWLTTPKHQTWFNTCSGLILIAVGIFMALSGHLK